MFPELQSVYIPSAPKSKRYPSLQSWILNGEKRNFLPSGENGEIEPCPRIRCHTTSNRRPLMAVAKADGSVDLFEWELEQVSYGFILTNSVCLFSFSPTTQNRRNNCFTPAPCAWRLLISCACLLTGQIGGYQRGMDPLRMFCEGP